MASMTIFAAIAATVIAFGALTEHLRLRHYWQRACTGRAWRRRFPAADKREIRLFLQLFIDAFGFANARRLRFTPDDQPLAVYKALYPWPGLSGDAMELETFLADLQREFGVDVQAIWREDIRLGELYAGINTKSTVPRSITKLPN